MIFTFGPIRDDAPILASMGTLSRIAPGKARAASAASAASALRRGAPRAPKAE